MKLIVSFERMRVQSVRSRLRARRLRLRCVTGPFNDSAQDPDDRDLMLVLIVSKNVEVTNFGTGYCVEYR